MSNRTVNNLSQMGIEIKLSEEGAKELAAILADGCPIKFEPDSNLQVESIKCSPIKCSMWYSDKSCKACWYKFLKNFIKQEV